MNTNIFFQSEVPRKMEKVIAQFFLVKLIEYCRKILEAPSSSPSSSAAASSAWPGHRKITIILDEYE